MHTHTLLYKILVEDVLGEARTPTVSDDFIREWPRVLKAINRTKQTGENSEVFISGRSHKYENYDSGGEVKIKVVTIPKDKGTKDKGRYTVQSRQGLSRPQKAGTLTVIKHMDSTEIFRDFGNRILKAWGDTSKVRALKVGLVNKLRRYGLPESALSGLRDNFDVVDDFDEFMADVKMAEEAIKGQDVLARGEVHIIVDEQTSDVEYRSVFIHELTHAFDPKAHLPYSTTGYYSWPYMANYYYETNPTELDAYINDFAAVAADFPREFNLKVADAIKTKGLFEFSKIFDKLKSDLIESDEEVDVSSLQVYSKKLRALQSKLSLIIDTGQGQKIYNKHFQKFYNVLIGSGDERPQKSLRDRLVNYKANRR